MSHTHSGFRHELQVYRKPRSSWWIVGACVLLVIFARKAGL